MFKTLRVALRSQREKRRQGQIERALYKRSRDYIPHDVGDPTTPEHATRHNTFTGGGHG